MNKLSGHHHFLVYALAACAGFTVGLAVGAYQIPPFKTIAAIKDFVLGREPEKKTPPQAASPNDLAEELTSYLETKWREKYENNQRRYDFAPYASEEELVQIGKIIQDDFSEWIQFRPHIKHIKNLETRKISENSYHKLISVHFKNSNGLTVEGILSIPKAKTKIYPTLIIPNGTSSSAKEIFGLTKIDYHFSVGDKFSKDYIVFAVNIPPTTDNFREAVRSNDRNFYLSNSAGLNYAYYQIIDKISSAIDYLENLSQVDIRCLGIYGISLGGNASIIAAAFDDRLSFVVASGTNVFTPSDVQLLENRRFVYPHYYQYNMVERPEIFQLLYTVFPKRIIIELNRRDTTGVFREAIYNAELVRRYYKQRGVKDKVAIVDFDGLRKKNGHYMQIDEVKRILDENFVEENRCIESDPG